MCHFVVIKIAGGSKSFATNSALMRFFTAMDSPVSIETGRGRKAFVANVANMRPLPCMNANMPFQQTGPVKCFATIIAGQHVFLSSSHSFGSSWRWNGIIVVVDDGIAPCLRFTDFGFSYWWAQCFRGCHRGRLSEGRRGGCSCCCRGRTELKSFHRGRGDFGSVFAIVGACSTITRDRFTTCKWEKVQRCKICFMRGTLKCHDTHCCCTKYGLSMSQWNCKLVHLQ